VIESLLERLLSWATRRSRVVLVSAGALTVLSAAALPHLQVDTDVLHLLPRSGPATQAFKRYLGEFGSLDRVYVMFEAADQRPIADFAQAIDAYVARARELPEVRRVAAGLFGAGRDWSYVADRQLLLFDEPTLATALARFRPEGMRESLDESRTLLSLPSSDLKRMVQQDPLGLSRLLRERLSAGVSLPADPTQEGLVSADGRRRLIVIEPKEPPFDTAFSKRLLAQLAAEEAAGRNARALPDEEQVLALPPASYAGGYRVAVETEALVRRETINNTLQSLVAVLVLLALGLRSTRLVLYGAVPIALASIVVLGAAASAGVKLSAAASGSSAMLFGLGVDAGILLFLRYREEEAAGASHAIAIANLREPALSVMLGVVTTAATFLALLLMDFPTLQELGALVGVGILICGVLTVVIIPALLWSWPPAPPTKQISPSRGPGAHALGRFIARSHRAILAGAAILTIVLAPGISQVRLVATLDKLRPATGSSAIEAAIATHFGVTQDVHLVIAEGPGLEPLLEAHSRFLEELRRKSDGVQLQSPVALLPPASVQDARARRIQAAAPDVQRARADLARATTMAGFRDGAFAPFDERLARVLDPGLRLTFGGFQQHGLEDVLAPLIRRTPRGYSTVAYAFPSSEDQARAVQRAVAEAGGPLVLTGTPTVNRELEARFWPQFRMAAAVGGITVVLLMVIGFRSFAMSAFALLPTVMALIWALGLIGFAGVELDLFSVFGLLTFMGIGVDYGIHVVHRWRALGDPVAVVVRLGPAVLLAGGTTLAGFGTLCFSAYPPLRSLGIVLFTTVAAALVIALTVLPVLLQGRRP
jgi:predicted RND superfamily exporter protein